MTKNEPMTNLKRKNPMDVFFSIGDKVTGGDAQRKALFDYLLMWVMFFAFFVIMGSNINAFLTTGRYSYLGWAFVIGAILWFQYWTLRMARDARRMMKNQPKDIDYNKVDNVKDMLKVTKKKNGKN